MLAPVLIAPPDDLPASLDLAKLHLRVDHDDDDVLISSLISAAVDHLDGWTGVLGRCLVEQVWRQDFDALAPCLPLQLGPVIEIVSVKYVDDRGDVQTLDPDGYRLRSDAGGRWRLDPRHGRHRGRRRHLQGWVQRRTAAITTATSCSSRAGM